MLFKCVQGNTRSQTKLGEHVFGLLVHPIHLEESFSSSSWSEQNILFLMVFRCSSDFADDPPPSAGSGGLKRLGCCTRCLRPNPYEHLDEATLNAAIALVASMKPETELQALLAVEIAAIGFRHNRRGYLCP
jgi:hypothetical protein